MQLGDFTIEFLGVEFLEYFQGFMPHTPYDDGVYGFGNTEEEALEDCLMQFAWGACVDVTEEVAHRIRDAYGDTNNVVCGSDRACYIGMQWNEV